jgi:hypothetical protein
MTYQNIHFILVLILVIILSLIGLFGKAESSFLSKIFFLLIIGSGLAVLGLGVSWIVSKTPINELASFQSYENTLGFIRVYLAGLSILLTIPVLIVCKLILKVLGK